MEGRHNYPSNRLSPQGISLQRPTDPQLRAIIIDGNAEVTVDVAEEIGRSLAENKLSTSQIRNFFGAVREIEMSWPEDGRDEQTEESRQRGADARRRLILLGPKLGYYAAKGSGKSKTALEQLKAVLVPAIGLAKKDRRCFGNFVDFFEAILAYHRAYGGN